MYLIFKVDSNAFTLMCYVYYFMKRVDYGDGNVVLFRLFALFLSIMCMKLILPVIFNTLQYCLSVVIVTYYFKGCQYV